MTWWFIVGIWCLFVAICILTAEWNDSIRRKRIKDGNPKQIEHFWWFFAYCILCSGVFYISHNWIQIGSILLLRASVFPVSYNMYAGLAPFNLSKTSKAIFDRLQVRLGLESSEEVNIIAFCISVILLFIQIFVK